MKNFKAVLAFLLLVSVVVVAYPRNAYAYLDAGTGSYIIQVVIGTVVVAAASVGIYWRKFKGIIKAKFGKKNNE